MDHPLDNPIYHALNTAQQSMSEGNVAVKYYQPSIAAFAGLEAHSEENFELLYQLSAEESVFVIFSKTALPLGEKWELLTHIDMYQLVCERKETPNFDNSICVDLTEMHVEEMKDLVELTKPGPFLDRTIEFGNYTGVFNGNQLVAMAGQRFNPAPYREISAVCTHPEHLGKGYGFTLLQEQIKRILTNDEIPFLHVRADNEGAIHLYQKLGFVIRTEMIAYVIKKN